MPSAAPNPEIASAEGLAAAFGMPPAKAIAWFESLGVRIGWDWSREWAASNELAFSLSRVADLSVLTAVKEEVGRAIAQGVTQAAFRKQLAGRLAALGWLRRRTVIGADGSIATVDLTAAHRMDVILRTNSQAAFMAGRWTDQQEAVVTHPYLQYVAVMDSRTRATHAALNGRVYRVDDPIWRTIYPPNGFNCRCRVRSLTAEQVEQRKLQVGGHALPDAFPDPGFDYNPGVPGAQQQAMAGAIARLIQRSGSAGAVSP